jgi:PilZ domain
MNERRTTLRRRVFKAGTIEFDGSGVECTIRNISEIGAGLEVASLSGIPSEITLNIPSRGARHHGHIVWRQERRIGVAFNSAVRTKTV